MENLLVYIILYPLARLHMLKILQLQYPLPLHQLLPRLPQLRSQQSSHRVLPAIRKVAQLLILLLCLPDRRHHHLFLRLTSVEVQLLVRLSHHLPVQLHRFRHQHHLLHHRQDPLHIIIITNMLSRFWAINPINQPEAPPYHQLRLQAISPDDRPHIRH